MPTTLPALRVTPSVDSLAQARGLLYAGSVRAATVLLAVEHDAPSPDERVERLALLVRARLAVGDLAAASHTGSQLTPHQAGSSRQAVLAHLAQADLASAVGDHQHALDHLLRAGELPDAMRSDLPPWRSSAALALVHLGRRTEAVALARDQVELSEERREGWRLAYALRVGATIDTAVDPYGTLRRARDLARDSGDRRLVAQISTDLAGLLLLVPSSGSLEEAVPLLRAAEDYAAEEGLWPLHGRVTRLLQHAGVRPRPLEDEALSTLTRAEQRVARLTAQGLTNRRVAEQLGITIKGVEWHLSRVYRKLGIPSRAALVELLDGPA